MKILILSTSLNARSKSHTLGLRIEEHLEAEGAETVVVELGGVGLPLCGMPGSFDDAQAMQLTERIREADGIIIASPVYNYDVNAACKNAVELTGVGWENKVVGFILVAGGQASYMSGLGLANSLMLDFRCVIVPRFVYATGEAFRDGALVDVKIDERLGRLARDVIRLAGAWSTAAEA